jgi:hypothetical protein
VSAYFQAGRAVTSQLAGPLRLSRSIVVPPVPARPAPWCTIGAQVGTGIRSEVRDLPKASEDNWDPKLAGPVAGEVTRKGL